MKIGRNSPCPCGSGKKYKKCCLSKDELSTFSFPNHHSIEKIPSNFEHIGATAHDLSQIMSQYDFCDLVIAVFCVNAWRRNRSALSQGLTLNMALSLCSHGGVISIKTFSEFKSFFTTIASSLKLTSLDDYIIDDFGEIFLNYSGRTYSIITGTGHQQVYAAMRYMQQLAQKCNRSDELTVMLDYIDSIICATKDVNVPNIEEQIIFELPSRAFWDAIKALFTSSAFAEKASAVSKVMGYQVGPIEMRHFVQHGEHLLPLFNAALLVDYYKLLLMVADDSMRDGHITDVIFSLLETTYNFSTSTPSRILLKPVVLNRDSNKVVQERGLFFSGSANDRLLIVLDKSVFTSATTLNAVMQRINELHKIGKLRIAEQFFRKEIRGGYVLDVDPECTIIFAAIDLFTDITLHRNFFSDTRSAFECSALDLFYLLGFSDNLIETIDYIQYAISDETEILSVGGMSNHFFAWKQNHHLLSSGAIDPTLFVVHYNQTESYVYSYFREKLCNFPTSACALFFDPLNWGIAQSGEKYCSIRHKGHIAYGGDVCALPHGTYIFLAHNSEFFTKHDFSGFDEVAIKTIDDLNQRLFMRYAAILGSFSVLQHKACEFLYMPFSYAQSRHPEMFSSHSSEQLVFADEYVQPSYVVVRYAVNAERLLNYIQEAPDRRAESAYFAALLLPLAKYSPDQYSALKQQLDIDSVLKKTVDIFAIERPYYYSERAVDTDVPEFSFALAKKEIAKICLSLEITPGIYYGKEATKTIRQIQKAAVSFYEKLIADYDFYHLHKVALNYYAIQLYGCLLNKKRLYTFTDMDESVRQEFTEKTMQIREEYRGNLKTAEYLLESNLSVAHTGALRPWTKDAFCFLLAFSDWMVSLQDSADTCFHTELDISVEVDSEYRVTPVYSDVVLQRYEETLARKYKAFDFPIKSDDIDKAFLNDAVNAFTEDTGINFRLFLALLDYLRTDATELPSAEEVYPNVFEINRTEMENGFKSVLEDQQVTLDAISACVDFIILDPSLLKTIESSESELLPIWEREKRDNRFCVKPIIVYCGRCVYSPIVISKLYDMWYHGTLEWYLPYEIGLSKFKAVLNRWKKRYEDDMVQEICQLFARSGFDLAVPEVDLFCRFPQDDYPAELGDYDVIAINSSSKTIWIIESKVLQKVGSIYEDQMQQKSFFFQHKDDEKFQRRIDYLLQNTRKVLASFGFIKETDMYEVIPYMVTNKLFASRYKEVAFPIITFSELQSMLGIPYALGD